MKVRDVQSGWGILERWHWYNQRCKFDFIWRKRLSLDRMVILTAVLLANISTVSWWPWHSVLGVWRSFVSTLTSFLLLQRLIPRCYCRHYNFKQASDEGEKYDLRKIFDDTLVQRRPVDAVTMVDNHDTRRLCATVSSKIHLSNPDISLHRALRGSRIMGRPTIQANCI